MKVRKSKYTENSRKPIQIKWLKCSTCDEEVEVEESVASVTCWRCAMKRTEPPVIHQVKEKSDKPKKPKGYHLMKVYVDPEGNVFHKGKEQPELKGTLKPTPIKLKKTMAQKDIEQQKKDAKLVKFHEKKKELKNNGNTSLVENTLQEVGQVESISTS